MPTPAQHPDEDPFEDAAETGRGDGRSAEGPRLALLASLGMRRVKIEAALVERVRAIPAPARSEDELYRLGTREVITAVFDHCLKGLADETEWSGAPQVAVEQARRAARIGIGIDVLVRRLFAGHALLAEAIGAEAARVGLTGECLSALEGAVQQMFERLTAELTAHHNDERERLTQSSEQRRLELVRRLLAGEEVDTGELLHYPLDHDIWHTALIVHGASATSQLNALARRLGLRLLAVQRDPDTVWGWLAARREVPMAAIEELLSSSEVDASIALGPPGRGVEGWRESHVLAQSARLVALRHHRRFTAYTDVILEAALLANPAFGRCLTDSYLRPLDALRMGGEAARGTLSAYIACEGNVACAASRLRLSRRTVERRLQTITEALGRPLRWCAPELSVALRLEGYGPS